MTLSGGNREAPPRRLSTWISRPRLVAELGRACGPDSIVFVLGPAGSGKSLAVDELAKQSNCSVRWVTPDSWSANGAESLNRAQTGDLVVVDGLDRYDRRAQHGCLTALSHLPAGVSTIITSRFAPPSAMARERLAGRVVVIDPGILALDRREAVEMAEAHGIDATAVAEMYDDAGGWIAAFVLHARARSAAVGRDALDAYIATEILPSLSSGLRFALACTANLNAVSERLLVELADDQSIAGELVHIALPGASRTGELRLPPCVRRLLTTTIDGPTARSACTQAAWRLRAANAPADAADALVSAGHLVAAEAPAAEAAARGAEGDRVLRWLSVLDPDAARRRPPLRDAQLGALQRRPEHGRLLHIARAMRASGELEGLLARGERAAAWAVAALLRQGHATDLLALLGSAERAIWEPAAWALGVLCKPHPAPPPPDVGAVAMLPLAELVAEGLLWQGQSDDALTLLELAERHDPELAVVRSRVLLSLGDVEGARVLLQPISDSSSPDQRLTVLECELAVATGEFDEALRLLPFARSAAERAGDLVAARIDLAIVEGRAHWLKGESRFAIPLLETARSWALKRGLRAAVEWIDVWLAGALVAAGSAAMARQRLEQSLADMARAGRRLGRPLGSLVLAEAAWLEGDERTHDEAVDDAVAQALRCAGRIMLRCGDRFLPGPLARRDRSSAHPGVQHRLLARAVAAADLRPDDDLPIVLVRTLGRAELALLPDEQPLDSNHRVVEFLAFLASRRGASSIDEARSALLPDSSGIALLKRAVRDVNRVLPPGVGLRLTASSLEVDPPGALVSDDGELMRLAGAAALARGSQATELRSSVLLLAAAGPFLPGVDADWILARRDALTRATADCAVGVPASQRDEGSPDDSHDSLQLDLTSRLRARVALAQGVSAETAPAHVAPERRSQPRRDELMG